MTDVVSSGSTNYLLGKKNFQLLRHILNFDSAQLMASPNWKKLELLKNWWELQFGVEIQFSHISEFF